MAILKNFSLGNNDNAILEIEGYSEISFNIVSFNLPGISTGLVEVPNPFMQYQTNGDKLLYEELTVQSLLAENMSNWLAIRDWIREGSNGVTFSNADITRKTGNIIVTNNNSKPILSISLKNMFPYNLSGIEIDLQQAESIPLQFSTVFQYESYDINIIN